MDCLFCKIIANELPSLKVYEDHDTIAFLELFPSAPGHTMVIHKRHGNNIFEYSQDELGSMMGTVQTVSEKIEKALKTDSITIGINHKERKGVPHLHIHLIPRWDDDRGHVIQGVVTHKKQEDREVIAEKIRKSK